MKTLVSLLSIFILCSCKTASIEPMKENEVSQSNSDSQSYFKAQGNEPFWSLEISTNAIQFKGLESENQFTAPHVEPIRAMDANVKMYKGTTEKDSFQITITQTECTDSMSGIKYMYQVAVEITSIKTRKSTTYNGCGAYSVDYRLHDIWVLETLEGKPMLAAYFLSDLPMLEINSKMANFSGFGGCNKIRGSIFQEKELLRFMNIISSRMACEPNNKEDQFLKALQSSTTYEIKNNRLYLSNPDGVKVIFKKID